MSPVKQDNIAAKRATALQVCGDILEFLWRPKPDVFHGKFEHLQAFVPIKTSDLLAGNRTIYVVIAKPKQLF